MELTDTDRKILKHILAYEQGCIANFIPKSKLFIGDFDMTLGDLEYKSAYQFPIALQYKDWIFTIEKTPRYKYYFFGAFFRDVHFAFGHLKSTDLMKELVEFIIRMIK